MAIDWPADEPDIAQAVRVVHAWALRHFTYVSDEVRWHEPEYWASDADLITELADTGRITGDCDDFALLTRLALRRMNHPSRLVLCTDELQELHLVTEAQGWVLDNRQLAVATRDELERVGYHWVSMSGYEPGEPWRTIKQ